jgi:hypothetical protein
LPPPPLPFWDFFGWARSHLEAWPTGPAWIPKPGPVPGLLLLMLLPSSLLTVTCTLRLPAEPPLQ